AFLALHALLGGSGLLPAPARADEAARVITSLKRTLRRGEASEKRALLEQVGRQARGLPAARRRSAAVVVQKAMKTERSAEVRVAMVRTLARLGGATGWVPVILAWLQGRDSGTKAVARKMVLWGGGDYLAVVRRLLREDKDPTFRAELLLLLGDRRRPDAIPLVLEAMERDRHPRVESAGAEALEALTGQALGYDLDAWKAWWSKRQASPPAAPVGRGEAPPKAGGVEDPTVTVVPEEPADVPEPKPHIGRSLVPRFYGLPITAKDVVFVIDISGSVGSGGVGRAKRELIQAVERLGSDVHIAALFFADEVHMWKPEMVRATPANKAALALFLRGIERGQRTDVFTPLNAGIRIVSRRLAELREKGEPVREAVTMIIVSDGRETSKHTPPSVVEDKLSRLDPAHTVIHAIAIGGRGSRLLAQIARRAGGHYIAVP
ncbi:MAG: VWA domain-containing protein, partial [Planctomycetota bacterium]